MDRGDQHEQRIEALPAEPHPAAAHPSQPIEPPHGLDAVRTHEDVLSLIDDVERQLERLRGAQARSAEDLARFADRNRRLDEREQEIHRAAALLSGREAQLAAMHDAIERERSAVAEREAQLRDAGREHEEAAAMLESMRAEIAASRAALDGERTTLAAEREALLVERNALRSEAERIRVDAASLEDRRTAIEARVGAQNEEVERLSHQIAAAQQQTAMLMLELARMQERCLDAESSLAARDAVVELREREVAERQRELVERDARLRSLEAERDQVRTELDSTRQSLRTAGDKLAALAKSVADHAPQLERGAAAVASLDALQRRLDARETELSELRASFERAAREADEKRARLERDAEATAELLRAEKDAATAEAVRLREELAAVAGAASVEAARVDEATLERVRRLEATEAKLAAALAFLRSRKSRLDRARRLLRERKFEREAEVRESTENALVRVLEEERLVKKQREELRQVQEMLSASEESMLRRYARHRGGLVAAWTMLVIASMAVGAWFASDLVLPRRSVAAVDLVARVEPGSSIAPETDNAWQSLHRDVLRDDAFRTTVRKRLEERGVNALRSVGEIDAWMDGVRIDSDGPGSMRLVAEAPSPEIAVLALDTLATSLVNEAPKYVKGRSDMPRAMIAGQTPVPGRVVFSSLVPQEGSFDRLMAAGLLFSGVVTLGLVTGGLVFSRIAKAKRRFEDAERFGGVL